MKYSFFQLYNADKQRYIACSRYTRLLLKFFRRCQTTNNTLLLTYYRWRFKRLKDKKNIEIYGKCNIGPGLYLGHVFGIVFGNPCNIKHKEETTDMYINYKCHI